MGVFHNKQKFYHFKSIIFPFCRVFSDDPNAERPEEYKKKIFDVLKRFDALAYQIGDEMATDGDIMRDHYRLMVLCKAEFKQYYRYRIYK